MMIEEQGEADKTSGDEKELEPLSLWEVIQGVFAMAIGVRSEKQRIKDFSRGKFLHFAIAGVLLAATFISIIATVVVLILS